MRPMRLLAMGLGALLLAAAGAGAQDAAGLTRTDRTGPVTVEVTPLPPMAAGEPLKLKVVLDTHSVNLDAIALERVVVVRSGAGAVPPVAVESAQGSGHHREALLVYPGSVLAGGSRRDAGHVADVPDDGADGGDAEADVRDDAGPEVT